MNSDAKPTRRTPAGDTVGNLRQLGKYQIERKLGVGGMGAVFLAIDSDLKRTVALKVLPKERAQNPTLVRRFKAEGQAAALLHHKNIINVYEAGQADGYLFLALEYVDGIDVLAWINRRGVLPVRRSIEIIRQTAEALQHAHEQGIVHRDIKPSNLMISRDGTVKLADMGLARSIDDTLETNITRDGTTVGTVDYMAPEQASNSRAADTRSDLYSLGCTWYHMLTGIPPYSVGSVTNKLTAHLTAPIPNPRQKNDRVPEAVVAVMQRMMAKRPEDRYQTPSELIEELQNAALQREEPSDLLAMFAEAESALDSGDVPVSPSADTAVADVPARQTPVEKSGPQRKLPARAAPGEQGRPAPDHDAAAGEFPQRKPRKAPLTRMTGLEGRSRESSSWLDVDLWKLTLLAGVIILALLGSRWVRTHFQETPVTPKIQSFPYSSHTEPEHHPAEPDASM